MSLDNVLAVAGAAKGSTLALVIGLAIAIVLMAVASAYIAKLLVRQPWIAWIGLAIILWVALEMIYEGSHQVTCKRFRLRLLGDAVAGHPAPIGAHLSRYAAPAPRPY